MTQKVKITYSHPGLQPPVYFAGSLGERPWEPTEMNCVQREDGEHDFWQEFDVEEGEYQYKFRLGPGDWWALDETKAIVDDGTGNRNNLLVVKPEPVKVEQLDTHVIDQATAPVQAPEQTHTHVEAKEDHSSLPQAPHVHEDQSELESSHAQAAEKREAVETRTVEDVAAPVRKVEHLEVPSTEQHLSKPETSLPASTQATADPAELEVEADDAEDEEDDQIEEPIASPLFAHEALTPRPTFDDGDDEEDENDDNNNSIPLFRHESMSPIESRHSFSFRSNSNTSHNSHHYDNEDINDPSLERFPTERDSIIAQLHRSGSRSHHEDEMAIEANPESPSFSSTQHLSAAISPVMSFVKDSAEHLDCINEDEAEELSPDGPNSPANGLGLDYKSIPGPDMKNNASKYSLQFSHDPVNRGPLTPPMTPIIDEPQIKTDVYNGHVEEEKKQEPPSRVYLPEMPKAQDTISADHTEARSSKPKSTFSIEEVEDTNGKAAYFWGWISKMCSGRIGSVGLAVAVGVAAAFYAIMGRNPASKVRDFAEA